MAVTDPTVEPQLARQVGEQLTAARQARGLSRRALAAELGLADTTLLALEHGRANPTLARLEQVATGYGIELAIETREPADA